jgi:hypothetical protein
MKDECFTSIQSRIVATSYMCFLNVDLFKFTQIKWNHSSSVISEPLNVQYPQVTLDYHIGQNLYGHINQKSSSRQHFCASNSW